MATFTGTGGIDVANATNGTLTGFTGGTVGELQDAIGDTYLALGGNDTIVAGAGNDTITAGSGDDSVTGGAGQDRFIDGLGNDTYVGGGGVDLDIVDYSQATGGIRANLKGGVVNNGIAADTVLDGSGGTDSIVNVRNIVGSNFNDEIYGGGNANSISGGSGDDTIAGLGGADTLDGGTGYDYLNYSRDAANGGAAGVTVNFLTGTATDGFGSTNTISNFEGVRGTLQADNFTGSNRTDEIEQFIGLSGNDTINGLGGFDEVRYDRDSIDGGNGAVSVNLQTGFATDGFGNTDTLSNIEAARGTTLADTFTGSTGDNEFRGLGGNDTFDGGSGFDVLRYDSDQANGGAAGITANFTGTGSGTVTDGFGATDAFTNIEGVRGTALADTFNGSSNGSEEFFGLAGNDTLNGGTGTGFDWARYDRDIFYSGGTSGVSANLSTGVATDGFGNTDTLIGIEGLRGTSFADSLTGDANNNAFIGLAGADTINGGNGFDLINYFSENSTVAVNVNLSTGLVIDTAGNTDTVSNIEEIRTGNLNDTITGSNVGESFSGNGGNDTFVGGGGRDFMRGGTGNDRLDGSAGTGAFADMSAGDSDTAAYNDTGIIQGVVVNLDTGTATDGFGNFDTLIDIERVRGTSFNDTITGSNTANLRQERFEGLGGNDTLNGQAGFDVAVYSNDAGSGGAAGITLDLDAGTATDGFGAFDTLQSIEGVISTNGNDSLKGSAANNQFRTLGGNDTIDGLGGLDAISFYVDDQIGGVGGLINLATGTGTNLLGGSLSFTSIEAVDGSYRNDTILGSTGADNLFGDLGNDSMDGGDGDDTINGSAGVDTMTGGIGNDWLSYVFDTTDPVQNGVDANQIQASFGWTTQNWNWTGVVVNLLNNTNFGADGARDIFSGFENVAGTYYNDWLTGDAQSNTFRGYAGNDTMDGGTGSDTVTYAATYSRTSGLAINLIVGEAANGVIVNLATGTASDGFGGTDRLISIENVTGSLGADSITGNDSNNALSGGDGNDTIVSHTGTDVITGGIGTDLYMTGLALSAITVSGTAGAYVFTSVLDGQTQTVNEMENYAFAGGAPVAVPVNMTFNAIGGATGGDNVIVSAGLDDSVDGLGGNDVIYTLGGNDRVFGGIDNDVLVLGTGDDAGIGGDGNDYVVGEDGNDALGGGNGNDVLLAGNGDDILIGGADSDYLYGGTGNNYMTGGAGLDIFISEGTSDTMEGGDGAGYFYRQVAGTSFTTGGANADIFVGGAFASNDIFNGAGGDDYALGGAGNDELIGGDGNDILISENGNDTLDGGSGFNYLYMDGTGSDVVRVNGTYGGDQILFSFEAGGVNDLVQISGSSLTSFADIDALRAPGVLGTVVNGNLLQNTGGGAILTLNIGTAYNTNIWFQGTLADGLTTADFSFL
jgi:Ca2+-binding RTX toxin-like protein